MSREIAIYIHIGLSLLLLLTGKYVFSHIFLKKMVKRPLSGFWASFQKRFAYLNWYLPIYPVFLNLVGWGQIVLNTIDLYYLGLHALLFWVAFIVLEIAFRKKIFLYALAPALVFVLLYAFLSKGITWKVYMYPLFLWAGFVRLCVLIKKGTFFTPKVINYMLGVMLFFVILCFVLPRARDYEVWLFLELFFAWIVFLVAWVVVIYKNIDSYQRYAGTRETRN